MKRIENSVRNIKYGVLFQLVDLVMKFSMRTALVYSLGDAVVGLNGLFVEVLSMISMAEMGIGTAIIYSLYKPLAEHDEDKVRQLMALFQRAYNIIALAILAVGLCVTPWIHLLVRKVDFDLGYIRLVFLLYLLSTSISYLFASRASLFNADQKTYCVTKVKIFIDILWTGLKIAALLWLHDFIVFLALDIAAQLTRNLLITRAANRMYPYLRVKSALPPKEECRSILTNIRHIFIGKLSGRITSSTDNMLISTMDSTLSVGFYSNYAMILNNARTFLAQITAAASGGIGNQMTEDLEHCYRTLKRMTMLMFLVGTAVCAPLAGELSNLIGLWLGAKHILSDTLVGILIFNLFLYTLREPLWQFLAVSGLFQKDKYISILGSAVNLVVSIALGIPFGMTGIFIGTTATLVIQYILKAILLCKEKFQISPRDFLLFSASCILTATGTGFLSRWLCDRISIGNVWLDLLVGVAVSMALAVAVALALYARVPQMQYCIKLLRSYGMKLLRKVKKV